MRPSEMAQPAPAPTEGNPPSLAAALASRRPLYLVAPVEQLDRAIRKGDTTLMAAWLAHCVDEEVVGSRTRMRLRSVATGGPEEVVRHTNGEWHSQDGMRRYHLFKLRG